MVAHHRLHELTFFDDDSLVALLDIYPTERRQAFTMGTDPQKVEEWKVVDASGVSGKDLLAAVNRGRLWLNLLRVDLVDRRYREVMGQLQAELIQQCPRLDLDALTFGTLLISSPETMVYYHLDAPHQVLWHLRGSKRVWVYPAGDDNFAPRHMVENIFAGDHEYDEELPYDPAFDAHALIFDLAPGDLAVWPLNSPHRVVNLQTFNLSLVTGLATRQSERRALVYAANRFFSERIRVPMTSTSEHGLSASAKCLAYRLLRRARLIPQPSLKPYRPTLRVDPGAPLGVRSLQDQ
jgi:hypothetical protein